MHYQSGIQSQGSEQRLHVEMWTDIICPWCGIGERRFKQALNMFEHSDHVDISLRSFRLMPGEKPLPMETVLAGKYGLSPEEIKEAIEQLENTASSVGLSYNLAGTLAGDTIDGHRLIKLAEKSGKEWQVYNRLFIAAMSDHLSIFDHKVLLRIAVESGLDYEETRNVLTEGAFLSEVVSDEATMNKFGGHGVPFFILNRQFDYSGALSPDIFLGALKKAWGAKGSESGKSPAPDEAMCGPDGCVLPSAKR